MKLSNGTENRHNNILSGSLSSKHAFLINKSDGSFYLHAGHNDNWLEVKADIPSPNSWHYVVVTYDEITRTMKLYQDGVLVSSKENIPNFEGDGTMQLGSFNGGGNFDGEIKKVKVWNYARTEKQISYAFTNTTDYDISEYSTNVIWVTGKKLTKWDGDIPTEYLRKNDDGSRYFIKRICVDYNEGVWVIDNQKNFYKLRIEDFKFEKDESQPSHEGATDIAIHTPGSIWLISDQPASPDNKGEVALTAGDGNFTILHYGGTEWNTNVSGGGVAIDIENDAVGTPWIITKQGEVYRYRADEEEPSTSNLWKKINLPEDVKAIDISDGEHTNLNNMFVLGADGFVYKASKNDSGNWSFSKESTNQCTGTKIANLPNTNWVVNNEGKVFKAIHATSGSEAQWEEVK